MKKLISFIFLTLFLTTAFADPSDFAYKLFYEVSSPDENVILSPYSLSSVFNILVNGAAGNTREQMLQLFPVETMPEAKSLIIANAIWGDESLVYKKTFLEAFKNNKTVEFKRVNYISNPEKARDVINAWVENKTKNLITQLIPPRALTKDTRVVLTNAIYFKGLWEKPFDPKETESTAFYITKNNSVKVPMMKKEDHFSYMETDRYECLALNYGKSTLAMLFLLPKENVSLAEIVSSIHLEKLLQDLHSKKLTVFLPRFSLASTFSSLRDSLEKMGLTDAFNEKADFSNLAEGDFVISDVIQKAKIEVNEEGTVAAAASGIMMGATLYEKPTVFNANHPFVFILLDKASKVILFMGQVINPVGS